MPVHRIEPPGTPVLPGSRATPPLKLPPLIPFGDGLRNNSSSRRKRPMRASVIYIPEKHPTEAPLGLDAIRGALRSSEAMSGERKRERQRGRETERERLLLSQLLCRAAQSCCIAGGKSSRQDPNWEQNTPSGTRNRSPNAPLGDPLGAPRGDPVPGPKRARSRNLR